VKKSINRPEFRDVVGCLVAARRAAGLTQIALAGKLRHTQGWVSSIERGDSRLDLLQAHDWCRVCGTTLTELARMIDAALVTSGPRAPMAKKGKAKAKKRTA